MVDIHSHFLPGVDDGAGDLEEAVAMVEQAVADGTTHLVATPHCNDRYQFSAARNRELLEELRTRAGNRIELLAGCDFRLTYENLQAVLADKTDYTLNGGLYLLTEFDNFGILPHAEEIFYKLRADGIIPIISHPERIPWLQTGTKLLRRLAETGCPLQVTAASFTGRFGRPVRQAAERLLAERLVHIVASDAHDTEDRPPRLSEARVLVEMNYGTELAQALFVDNPRAVIESQPLPHFPEPAEPKKRRFWFF